MAALLPFALLQGVGLSFSLTEHAPSTSCPRREAPADKQTPPASPEEEQDEPNTAAILETRPGSIALATMRLAICSPVEIRLLAPLFARAPEALPVGLSSTVITLLIAALIERGHQLTVFTISPDVHDEVVLRGNGLTVFVGKMRTSRRARDLWAEEVGYLSRAIQRERPAFVHAHWTYEFALAALRSGTPTLTTIHDLPWNVLRYFRDPYRAARVLLAYMVAARGKHYTAVSHDAARHFRRYFSPRARIAVVPNFLSDAIFAQGALETTPSPHVLTYCTILQGWSTRKNAQAAIQAYALVCKRLPASRLLMIGTDFQPGGAAELWAIAHGLQDQIVFRGPMLYQAMLATFQAEADVLVHPSLDESFSMAALEAMVLGKPVIAGRNTPGVREVLEYGSSGVLVDVRNPSEIADAMVRLGEDPVIRATMAATARESASRRFRVEPVVKAYEALYEEQLSIAAAKFPERSDAAPPLATSSWPPSGSTVHSVASAQFGVPPQRKPVELGDSDQGRITETDGLLSVTAHAQRETL